MLKKLLKRMTRPSPFKAGVLVILISVWLLRSFISGSESVEIIRAFDDRIFDNMFKVRGSQETTGSVVIIDIDDKSLGEIGQWPWPRNIVSDLLKKVTTAKPKAIGLDIVFAEPDRSSPRRYADALAKYAGGKIDIPEDELDNDIVLGNMLYDNENIVLGYVFIMTDDGLKKDGEIPFPAWNLEVEPIGATLPVYAAYRPVLNTPAIEQCGTTEGFFNADLDASGLVRRVPLVMGLTNDKTVTPYPSLSLEMLRVGLGEKKVKIEVDNSIGGIRQISVGDKEIPTTAPGCIYVNYRGGMKTFKYVSACDILAGRLDRDVFKDKYVLLGTSAPGLMDLRAVPFTNAFPGVEVHANIIDNVIKGDPIRYDMYTEGGVILAIVVIGGLLISGTLTYWGPIAGALAGFFMLGLVTVGNYYIYFLNNQTVSVAFPTLSLLSVFLVVSLYNYFTEGREKKFINGAFGRYVSPQVVDQLVKSPEKLSLEGEEKVLSIMFSDIRGFTTISEALGDKIGPFLNEYLSEMTEIVLAHDGTVDKFIGDAIMAIWGAPLDDEQHAEKAVRACMKQMERLRQLQPTYEARGLPMLDIGLGVNTGRVMVGNMGSYSRFDYTVIGDDVNLASRLEGLNKPYGTNIIISESTYNLVKDKFFCRMFDMVRVKGKKLPVKIYEPLVEGTPDDKLKEEAAGFAQALEHYLARDFAKSKDIMKGLNEKNPHKLYSMYIDRITAFEQTPPPEDWDGVYTHTTK